MNESILIGSIVALLGVIAFLVGKLQTERRRRGKGSPHAPARRRPSSSRPDEGVAWQILDRTEEGVVLLDGLLRPLFASEAARTMLGLREGPLPNRIPVDEIATLAREAMRTNEGAEQVIRTWFPQRASLWVRACILEEHSGLVIMMRDITEELRTKQIRREFVAHASHELKSPVASLQTLAEAVREAVAHDREVARRFADQLTNEAARLGRLVGNLLDLSRLEEASAEPEALVSLSEIGRGAADDVRREAEAKHMALQIAIAPELWVRGDEHQLNLMVRNLLENAIRYTPEKGRVGLALKRHDSFVVLEVSDDGMGIPLEAQSRIFERFYRVDRARSRVRGGTGLGLAIVKHVVELHGGDIELQSELGQGSTFTVSLPAPTGAKERAVRSVAG